MSEPRKVTNPEENKRKQALLKALQALTSLPAKTIFYGSALLTTASIPGIELPGALATLARTLGVEALGSILERLVQGEQVSSEEIRQGLTFLKQRGIV